MVDLDKWPTSVKSLHHSRKKYIEGGKGTKGKIVKFQFRPDPLAR